MVILAAVQIPKLKKQRREETIKGLIAASLIAGPLAAVVCYLALGAFAGMLGRMGYWAGASTGTCTSTTVSFLIGMS